MIHMKILFYDIATPVLYRNTTIQERSLGGTEATIIRVAHALSTYHEVYIAQHCRCEEDDANYDGVHYLSLSSANQLLPDVVILLREYEWIETVGQLFPQAKHYFWMHNLPPYDMYRMLPVLIKYDYQVIAVSNFHRETIIKRLKPNWYQRYFKKYNNNVKVKVIYNPIEDALQPDTTEIDVNQMLFLSSPHKGLAQVLKIFDYLRRFYPEYRLFVCNPGNWNDQIYIPENVTVLGSIPHPQVIEYLRRSFCVFYPQTKRMETFGLIYAEANAVGTPVLAHPIGSAQEILADPQQLVDGTNKRAILEKILLWRHERPKVKVNPEFRLTKVIESWLKLFSQYEQ